MSPLLKFYDVKLLEELVTQDTVTVTVAIKLAATYPVTSMRNCVLVGVPAANLTDPDFALGNYVTDAFSHFVYSEHQNAVQTEMCVPCSGHVGNLSCRLCKGLGYTTYFYNAAAVWQQIHIGGEYGRLLLGLPAKGGFDPWLNLTRYSDLPPIVKRGIETINTDTLDGELFTVRVIIHGAVCTGLLPEEIDLDAWYFVICTATE